MGCIRKLKGMPKTRTGTKYLLVKGKGRNKWHTTKLKKRG